jgi:AcrR family transcriptional regulator
MGRKALNNQERNVIRDLILAAGMNLMKEGGIQAINLRDVARKAHYSVGSLYQYFANKESLLLALAVQICDQFYLRLLKFHETENPEQDLMTLIREAIEFHIEEPQGVELLTYMCFTPSRSLSEFDRVVNLFRKVLERLKYPRLQTKQDIEDALDMLRVLLTGSTQLIILQDTPEGKERTTSIIKKLIETLLRGWKSY